jgi:peptide/nickel transport system permease protein
MTLTVPRARKRSGRPAGAMRRVMRKPSAVIALVVLVAISLAVAFADVLAPYGSNEGDLTRLRELPSADHLLGTDDLGRDVLSRLLIGGQDSLGGAALATLIAVAIGVPLGMIAGYYRRLPDAVISRFADIMQAMPLVVVLMAVLGVFGNQPLPAMIALGIALSAGFIRLARATTLSVRRELYVDAANVAGIPTGRILARHVLPNVRGPLLVQASLVMASALLIQAGLGFLGLGTAPPDPSWGGMIANASNQIYTAPWLLVPSGLVLIVTILSLNFLGDALAEDKPAVAAPGRRGTGEPESETHPVADDLAIETVADPVVSVRGLTVRFRDAEGEFSVVQNVSFDVAKGESLGIVGESGCGKSVTARALMGIVAKGGRISAGTARIGDVEVTAATEKQLQRMRGTTVALVSQEPMVALDPSFTIGAQLREVVRHHTGKNRAQAHERALELLGLVGIPDPAATAASYTFQISGGMAQRAAIALALAGDPDVLIADEPTTALDVTVQAEILDLLHRLRAELGMALIIVTHDLGVVADSCDRAIVMYAGQIVESGAVSRLLEAPRHPYTVGLLSSMPSHAERGVPMSAIEGIVPAPRQWPAGCRFADRCPLATDLCRTAPVAAVPTGDHSTSRCLRIDELERAA